MRAELYAIADELRAAAASGLTYARDPYDRERCARMAHASARIIALLDGGSPDDLRARFLDNLHHRSPQAGAEAVVTRAGRLLLIRRHDDGLWAVPGGLVDVGETLAEAAVRELAEETGLHGRAARLLGIWDSRRCQSQTKTQMYHAVFEVSADTGEPITTAEATEVAYFAERELPPLSPGHHIRIPAIFRILRGEMAIPYFDPA